MALIGHWRDNVGTQLPGTTFAGFNFAQEIRNDAGGNYSKPNGSTIQLGDAGGAHPLRGYYGYEFSVNIKLTDTSNGRVNYQGRLALVSGTGDLFSTYKTTYSRNNNNNTATLYLER